MDDNKYIYRKFNTFNIFILVMFSVIFTIIGLFYFVGLIDALLSAPNNITSSTLTLFWYFIGFTVWSPLFFIFSAYLAPEVSINEDGLQTNFLFKNLFVKWEDVVEVKLSKPFGLRIGRKASILIVRNGLTLFHSIYGLIYGRTNKPALLIWSNISDYDSLMKKISKNRKKKLILNK